MQDQRKDFEAWVTDLYEQFDQKPNLARAPQQLHNYANVDINAMWWGWQGGQAAMTDRGGGEK